jgi:hypothetical protein
MIVTQKNWILAAAGAAFISSSTDALAYLDPGTGSAALQALFAVVAAATVGVGYYWRAFVQLVGRTRSTTLSGEGRQSD